MNNMLYIMIGLVVIVLVAVLVLRNSKAKKTPAQPIKQAGQTAAVVNTSAIKPPAESMTANQNATKFDTLTVTQRFMDQQRYDKAIETLERGLIEKPQDSKLSLKLLHVYTITNQHDHFNNLYDSIKINSDATTINDADQLKALLNQGQITQTLSSPLSVTETSAHDSFNLNNSLTSPSNSPVSPMTNNRATDERSLDFDISVVNHINSKPSMTTTKTDDNDAFDLTLEDLETTDLDITPLEFPDNNDDIDHLDNAPNKDTGIKPTATHNIDSDNVNIAKNLNIDNDFTLDFNLIAQDSVSSEAVSLDVSQTGSHSQDKNSQDISLDDDFVLNFDDLVESTDNKSALIDTQKTNNQDNQNNNEDATLFLADKETGVEQNDRVNNVMASPEDSLSKFDELSFDELSFDDEGLINDDPQPTADYNIPTVENTMINTDTDTAQSNLESFDAKKLDDNTLVESTLEFDSRVTAPIAAMPVVDIEDERMINDDSVSDQSTEIAPAGNFASQFAADFDFVNTLDSHQVTLELAGQYLQLGEYDSAKRLLNEVVVKGNSEQQSQAQEMLARTA